MYAMDGNDSLKRIARVGSREIGDTRCFTHSDYYILPEEVDQWAEEVGSESSAGEEEVEDKTNEDDKKSDSTNGRNSDSTNGRNSEQGLCANNWKAAQSDSKKRTWRVFAETGLFASACRHGFILWVADMIRSGERYVFKISASSI